MSIARQPRRDVGSTLIEAVISIVVVGIVLAVASTWNVSDRFALARAARLAASHFATSRLQAMASRETLEVRVAGSSLQLIDPAGFVRSRTDLSTLVMGRLDSVRLRPSTMRFNARGHGSAGSLYLYRGSRGVRVVSNFVGRVRLVPFRT